MAGRHLKALIAAYRDKDDLAFRRAAQGIIEEEEAKRHVALARDLRRMLASGSSTVSFPIDNIPSVEAPRDRESDLPLADIQAPRRILNDLILPHDVADRLRELADEVEAWPKFDAAGIPRRQTILLHGFPGTGKSSIAEALAGELGRALVRVRVEAVTSSYLGETATNLGKLFEFARSGPYIVLFDEFDSLGKLRDDPSDHGELRRVVNAVLQMIEQYEGPSLLVAATNHATVLDSAIWRRFSEVLELPLPDSATRHTLLTRVLQGRVEARADLAAAAEQLEGLPHSAVERAGQEALRLALLDGRNEASEADIAESVKRVARRRWM